MARGSSVRMWRRGLAAVTALLAVAATASGVAGAAVTALTATSVPAPQAAYGGGIAATSCPESGLCYMTAAVDYGSYYGTQTYTADAWTLSGGSWSQPTVLPIQGISDDVTQLYCPAAGSCVAAGYDYVYSAAINEPAETAAVWTLSGGAWTETVLGTPSGYQLSDVIGLSCPQAGSCVAIGAVGTQPAATEGFASWTLSGGTWALSGGTPVTSNGGAEVPLLGAVSCTTTSSCTAAIAQQNITDSADEGSILVLSGGSWSDVSDTASAEMTGVSCPAGGPCVAVGLTTSYAPLAYEVSGTSVSAMAFPSDTSTIPEQVSCPAAGSCLAVGADNFSSATGHETADPAAWQLSGGQWIATAAPVPSADIGAENIVDSVSCPTPTECTADGLATTASGSVNALSYLVELGTPQTGFVPYPSSSGGAAQAPQPVTTNPTTGGTEPSAPAPGQPTGTTSPLPAPGPGVPPIDAPWWSVSNSETGAANVYYTWQMALEGNATGVTSITFALPDGTTGTPAVAQCYGLDCAGSSVAMSGAVVTLSVPSQPLGSGVPVEVVFSGLTNTTAGGTYQTSVAVYSGSYADAQSPSNTVEFGQNLTGVAVAVPDSATFTDSAPDIYVTPIPGSGVAYAACGTGTSSSGDPATATGSAPCPVDLSVSTNSGSGFTISAAASALKTGSGYTLAEGSAAGSASFAEDTFAAEAAVTAGSATTTTPWGSSTWVGYSASPVQIASAGAATGTNTVTVAVTNAAEVDFAQAAGDYHGTLTYSLTPGY